MRFPRPIAKSSDRRAFLSPVRRRGGVPALDELFGDRRQLVRAGRAAMACSFEILFPAALRTRIMVAHRALGEIDQLEAQMTVFRDDSEIARLNRTAFQEPVAVEAGLFELLRRAAEISRDTGGAFDVTAGPLSRCWGFFARQGRLPEQAEIEAALDRIGSRHLEFDPESCSLRFKKPVEINLGAIGKGYALDRAAEILRRGGLSNALLHAGSSSVLAVGGGFSGNGWRVGVRHPLRTESDIALLDLRGRALGVSGVAEQSFQHDGRRLGHILDPRNGRPAEGKLCAAAVADSAAEADALSTAFFIMNPEEVAEYCQKHPSVGAFLVLSGALGGPPETLHFGLEKCLAEVSC